MLSDLPDIPPWILSLAAFAAAFVVYLAKLGFDKGKAEKPFPDRSVQVGAVVVDSQSLAMLIASIEAGTLELITTRKANDDRERRIVKGVEDEAIRMIRAVDRLNDEIKDHREEIRLLGDRIAARR